MWFVGGLVGAALGAMWFGAQGFFFGALIGGVLTWAIGQNRASRLEVLEKRVAALEAAARGERLAASPQAAADEPLAPTAPEAVTREPEPQPSPAAAAPQPSRPAAASSGPPFWERLVGGNLVAKVGILVLFFGVAFLLRYLYERVHVPIELRLTSVAIGALVLLFVGWRLREKRRGYALALQGGGIGVLYLVIFGAFRLFGLLPGPLAFALLAAVAASSAALAIAQNSLTLAVMGVSGGFLAPVLASTGQGSHVMLFSYYAVLNAGIVAIAWVKAWRVLNVLGFGFTFGIGTLWGAKVYRPELFGSTEPFLLLFFAMYVAIPLLFARRRAVELKDYADGTLIFGVPVVAFGLQVVAVRHIEYGAAFSAFGAATVYLGLAVALFRRAGQPLRLLVESFIALSFAFATLAIPLAFEGRLTSAAWALEGAAVVWIGIRQGKLLARASGYLLQFAAGIAFLFDVAKGYGATPILNSFFMGSAFLAAAALFCAIYVDRNRARVRPPERALAYVLIGWGALWWYGGGMHEIERYLPSAYEAQSGLLFAAASSVAFSHISGLVRSPSVRWLWLLLYPAMLLPLGELVGVLHPLGRLGAPAWIAGFAAHFWLLARHAADRRLVEVLHAVGVWLLALVGARELGWLIDAAVGGERVWPSISWAIVPATILFGLVTPSLQARWPIDAYTRQYVIAGGAPLAAFLVLWMLHANVTSDGDPYPLPYLPLLNPLDIAIAGVVLVLTRWLSALPGQGLEAWWRGARTPLMGLLGLSLFLWVNATLLRTVHHWTGLPFALEPMLSSFLVQAALSLLWSLLALAAMMMATRSAIRPLWMIGAGLMGLVVAKLFLIDLSGVGTVERIVSFIGVGLLMLLIGYLSPMPPKPASTA